jgi:hypothetical protein
MYLVIVYVVAGIAFAALMFVVSSRVAQTNANTVFRYGNFEVQTGSVLVALALVGLGTMCIIPGFYLWLNTTHEDSPVSLHVPIVPYPAYDVRVENDDYSSTRQPVLRLFRSTDPQSFTLSEPDRTLNPLHITAWYDRDNGRIMVSIGGTKPAPVDGYAGGTSAELAPLSFERSLSPAPDHVANAPTASVPLTVQTRSIADPTEVQEAATTPTQQR